MTADPLHTPIDLRCNTVTRPSDPTPAAIAAALLGEEAALFVPTGTMANRSLTAILPHI